MAITHSTPADSSFSPAGKAAWNAGHTGQSFDFTFTSGNSLTVGRSSQTFNGTIDNFSAFAYNAVANGASIPDPSDSSLGFFLESNYNNGSIRGCEAHIDLAVPGGSYSRPFYSFKAITGASAGLILDTNILSDVNMLLSASATGTMTLTAQTFTVGTSGASFNVTGNITAGGPGRVLLGVTTDTDSSSYIQLGPGDNAAGSRAAILCRIGGYASPSNANANSDGDKFVLYNTTTAKVAIGIDGNSQMYLQQHRPSGSAGTSGFRFTGGYTTNSADLATIDGNGSFLACAGTAIPAGGAVGKGMMVSATTNFGVFFGSGAPTLSAAQGSLYMRSDGVNTSTRAYVNLGTTNWTYLLAGA